MNKFKQKLLWCFALIILCLAQINQTYAQENLTVKGTVVDENNDPLIGVSIGISGSQGGTRTDVNGNFQLQVPAKAKNLKFSYIGFDSKSVAISATMNVELKAASNTLDVVTVTDYQVQKKKDVTGAVANISSKDFNQGNVTNSILQIQGKVAGLSIVQSSGDPNSNPTIRLRGQTSLYKDQSPLIIIDGVQLDGTDVLSNIPPGDIESYDVLKDASATSIYGSRGANGVIIVTTKKGVSGKTTVSYQGITAIDNQAKYKNLLNANEWIKASGVDAGDSYANTNWQKEITRQAYTQNHTVSLSGGGKGFSYRGSTNYIKQDNIIINSGKEQIGIRFNAEQKALNDKLSIQIGLASTITNRNRIDDVVPNFIFSTSPTIPVRNTDGSYNSFVIGDDGLNRVQTQNQRTNFMKEKLSLYSVNIKYEVLPRLLVGAAGNITTLNANEVKFRPTYASIDNSGSRSANQDDNYRGELNLSYTKSWGKHNFNAFAVYENNYFGKNYFDLSGRRIPFNFLKDDALNSADKDTWAINSNRAEYKIISALGRFNYNYDGKYYATVSLRRDGSSKFGPNNRWATFPAANFAWRISQENWMKDILWINDLKIRMGYGETGSQSALSEYNYLQLLEAGEIQGGVQTYRIAQNPNPNLRWEVRKGRNIGLDFAFLNSRLSGDINYFNDITQSLLFEYETINAAPIKNRGGKRAVLANVGTLTNKGIELALNYRIVDNDNFNWTLGGQISGVRTKITSLEDPSGEYTINVKEIPAGRRHNADITFLKEGEAPFIFYLPRFEGLDSKGNQIISTDKQYIDPSPKFNYGISNNFSYKEWSLGFFLRGVSGIKIYNAIAGDLASNVSSRLSKLGNTTVEALESGIKDNAKASDKWLENASFLRLDNATLGYTFKKIKHIQNLKLFVAGNNLLVITKYTGLDPEVQSAGASTGFGADNVNYMGIEESTPRTRSFSMGVNVTF